MAQVRPGPGALLLVSLLLLGSGHAVLVVPVSTPEQLLDALAVATAPGAPSDTVVELQQDMALTRAAAANFTLPFVIAGNRTLTLRGADGQIKHLDFGEIDGLLYGKTNASLRIDKLNVTGAADPQFGTWPEGVTSPTVVQSMPLWPTLWADPGFRLAADNSKYTLHPTTLCTPEVVAAQLQAFADLAKSSGSNATELYTNGTFGFFVDWAAPVPVLSPDTKVAIGTIFQSAKNTSIQCMLPSATEPDVVPVSTPEQLLAALAAATGPGAARNTVLELQQDVALTQAAGAKYTLPFVIASNRTLTLRGGDGQMKGLDLGELPQLLFMKPNSTLSLEYLNATGPADAQLGSWPEEVDSPTVIQLMPLWPTLGGDAGFTFVLHNSSTTLFPTDLCTEENLAAQADGLEALAQSAGSNATQIALNGTTGTFVDWAGPIPVLSPVTKVSIGTISFQAENTTLYCMLPEPKASSGSNASPPSPSTGSSGSSSSSRGGTPGWVWALVGVGAAVAVLVAAALLLWRRRHLRKQQPQQLIGVKVKDSEGESSGYASQPPLHCSNGINGGSLASPGSSSIYEQLQGGQASVPEGPWKIRVGFIDGLQLGGLIGRGGYARVYKGHWKGTMVAVKVVETHVGEDQCYDLRNEPLLSLSLSHPNVLQGYKMCAVRVLSDAENEQAAVRAEGTGNLGSSGGSQGPSISGSGGKVVPHLTDPNCMVEVMPADAVLEPGVYEMWLVSELADKGTLADAMKSGLFKQTEAPGRNLPAILLCLLDVARGLEYLHSCNIMHGDLKPQNVLLKTAGNDRRGFVCKLGDFGLSRMLPETQTHVNTGSCGTVTHASPELLTDGRLTKACDVFAFGMILWELVTGLRLFPDMHHMQIIVQVTQKGYRPPIPADFPPPLADLVQRCWAEDPHARPDAETIVQALIDYSASFSSTVAARLAHPA